VQVLHQSITTLSTVLPQHIVICFWLGFSCSFEPLANGYLGLYKLGSCAPSKTHRPIIKIYHDSYSQNVYKAKFQKTNSKIVYHEQLISIHNCCCSMALLGEEDFPAKLKRWVSKQGYHLGKLLGVGPFYIFFLFRFTTN